MKKQKCYIDEDIKTELFFKKALNFVLITCGVLVLNLTIILWIVLLRG